MMEVFDNAKCYKSKLGHYKAEGHIITSICNIGITFLKTLCPLHFIGLSLII